MKQSLREDIKQLLKEIKQNQVINEEKTRVKKFGKDSDRKKARQERIAKARKTLQNISINRYNKDDKVLFDPDEGKELAVNYVDLLLVVEDSLKEPDQITREQYDNYKIGLNTIIGGVAKGATEEQVTKAKLLLKQLKKIKRPSASYQPPKEGEQADTKDTESTKTAAPKKDKKTYGDPTSNKKKEQVRYIQGVVGAPSAKKGKPDGFYGKKTAAAWRIWIGNEKTMAAIKSLAGGETNESRTLKRLDLRRLLERMYLGEDDAEPVETAPAEPMQSDPETGDESVAGPWVNTQPDTDGGSSDQTEEELAVQPDPNVPAPSAETPVPSPDGEKKETKTGKTNTNKPKYRKNWLKDKKKYGTAPEGAKGAEKVAAETPGNAVKLAKELGFSENLKGVAEMTKAIETKIGTGDSDQGEPNKTRNMTKNATSIPTLIEKSKSIMKAENIDPIPSTGSDIIKDKLVFLHPEMKEWPKLKDINPHFKLVTKGNVSKNIKPASFEESDFGDSSFISKLASKGSASTLFKRDQVDQDGVTIVNKDSWKSMYSKFKETDTFATVKLTGQISKSSYNLTLLIPYEKKGILD